MADRLYIDGAELLADRVNNVTFGVAIAYGQFDFNELVVVQRAFQFSQHVVVETLASNRNDGFEVVAQAAKMLFFVISKGLLRRCPGGKCHTIGTFKISMAGFGRRAAL